jgi:hypothetical protein
MSSKKQGGKFLKGLQKYSVAPKETTLVIEKYLQALDCPRSLTVWLMFINNEHGQLANLEFDPLDYTASSVKSAYMATKFLSKFKGLTLSSDLDEAAWLKFREFELLCKQTNARFRDLSRDTLYQGRAVSLHNAVMHKIDKLLGEFSPEEMFSEPDWGPGASTLIKRRDASSVVKFQNETGITRDLYSLIPPEITAVAYPLWTQHLENLVYEGKTYPTYQVGNKVITVAKDAKTNRVIAIEPGINLWYQKAFGNMIGKRLRSVGVDLRYQSRNQQLAKLGSQDLSLATVDLSSASDSVSRGVVEALLPRRWHSVMDSCRSHYGQFLGQVVKWEKFSSMGNGFTFQLESLIFYAVAKSCVEYLDLPGRKTVSVYGDDVILPTSAFELFSEMMEFYGFRINEKKSHYKSPFRESCGSHYFSGSDLKPIYLKDRLSNILTVYRLANAVRRLAHRQCCNLACDSAFRSTFYHLVHMVPEALRLWVPDGLGDGGFIGNFDECTPIKANVGKPLYKYYEGYRVLHLTEVAVSYDDERYGYLLAELWRISERDVDSIPRRERSSTLETIRKVALWCDVEIKGRNSVPLHRTKMRLAKSVVRRWYDLGPWV